MQVSYINIQYPIGCISVKYDRLWNRKNYFILPIERGISRAGKFKANLYFPVTEICLCFNLNFLLLLKIPDWNSKRRQFQNYFSYPVPPSYIIPGHINVFRAYRIRISYLHLVFWIQDTSTTYLTYLCNL